VPEHPTDSLPERAAGVLDASQVDEVRAHLASCPSCAAWLAELTTACPPPAAPIATLQLQQMIKIPAGHHAPLHRFRDPRVGHLEQFRVRVSELFEIDREKAGELLGRVEHDKVRWVDGPAEGIQLFPVMIPQNTFASLFIRAKPWAVFPLHSHTAPETTLLLQGGFESRGSRYWRGDRVLLPTGSNHTLVAQSGADCLCAVKVEGELVFSDPAEAGVPSTPTPPII
jgi:anti-sigma factor ChrR (cupin superfamily)